MPPQRVSRRSLKLASMLIVNLPKKLIRHSTLLAPDFLSFKRQEWIFIVLNLVILAALLLIHTLFLSFFGTPPRLLVIVLAVAFLINTIELIWVQGATFLNATQIVILTWFNIALNLALALVLALLSYRQDTQYFALLIAPILQSAFRLSFFANCTVVAASMSLEFFWVWHYFRIHPPTQITEFVEAGTISMIYAIIGILVWSLVNQLRLKESVLTTSLLELQKTKQRLVIEEKLAAVGRLSAAIAHEIRNPVAMISSALATAFNYGVDSTERQEMFGIAAREASRLEKLTTDFLTYARPRQLAKESFNVSESIAYVADICRPKAAERNVVVETDAPSLLSAWIDSSQVQQALLNLVMNAIEASAAEGHVFLRGRSQNGFIRVEVDNANGPIPPEAVERIFEPFFSTKPTGTGLGLAIARNIARSHGGELALSQNKPDLVQFSISFSASPNEVEGL
jgi:two-component system, NtrC family, sensor histidine kinase HydH